MATVTPGVVLAGFASDGFAATACAVAFESPLAIDVVFVFVLFATAIVAGATPVPETVVAGVIVAPLATALATITLPSPSEPLVMIGVPLELTDEFAVCSGLGIAGGTSWPVFAPAVGFCCEPDGLIGPSTRPRYA